MDSNTQDSPLILLDSPFEAQSEGNTEGENNSV